MDLARPVLRTVLRLAIPLALAALSLGALGGAASAATSYVNAAGDHCSRTTGRAAATCVRRVPGRAPLPAAAVRSVRAAADIPDPPTACQFDADTWVLSPDRQTSCSGAYWEIYTYTGSGGQIHITGAMDLGDVQWNSYNNRSLTWTHGLILYVYAGTAWGTLEDGTSGSISSRCVTAPNCNVSSNLGTPDGQAIDLTPGSTITDGWTETDALGADTTPGQIDPQDQLGAVFASADPDVNWSYTDDFLSGRCDSVIPKNSVGCVNPDFTPTLDIPLSTGGASADMVRWAQQNLSGHWGLRGQGEPLHRLGDDGQTSDNRGVICDGSFTPDQAITDALAPYGDKDSCDEFPFARTYESGAMTTGADGAAKPYVTSGAQCAQVTAVQTGTSGTDEAADWKTVQPTGTPSGTEPCVRGHIPNLLNGAVGRMYGNFSPSNRLVDKDPFWLAVTS